MTREILEKYVTYRGMRVYKIGATSTQVFMPFMLMDTAYQIFSRTFQKHINDYRHERKKWLKFTSNKFLHFFTEFNLAFTEDDLDVISEDMDKFSEFTQNERMFIKVALSNGCATQLDTDMQMVIADLHMVNMLAQCAAFLWKDTFHSRRVTKGDENTDINGVLEGTKNLAESLISRDIVMNDKDHEAFENAKNAFLRKVVAFTKEHQTVN